MIPGIVRRMIGRVFRRSAHGEFIEIGFSKAELWIKRINDAVLAEREACAAKAEQVGQHKNHIGIAAAIRARGQA